MPTRRPHVGTGDRAATIQQSSRPRPRPGAGIPSLDQLDWTVDLGVTPLAQAISCVAVTVARAAYARRHEDDGTRHHRIRKLDLLRPNRDAGLNRRKEPAPRTPRSVLDLSPEEPERERDAEGNRLLAKRWPLAAAAVGSSRSPAPASRRARYFVAPAADRGTDGTLIVTIEPAGRAAVRRRRGARRHAADLTSQARAPHSLELRGNGAPRLMPITIAAGAQISQIHRAPDVVVDVGQLQVRTEPAGARVTVDGVARGTSPVTVADLTPGEHAVVARKRRRIGRNRPSPSRPASRHR